MVRRSRKSPSAVMTAAAGAAIVELVKALPAAPLNRHKRDEFCAIGQHAEFDDLERWIATEIVGAQREVDKRLTSSYQLLALASA